MYNARNLFFAVAVIVSTTTTTAIAASSVDQELRPTGAASIGEVESQVRLDVERRLIEMGVSPEDAAQRVQRLTDEELSQLDEGFEELPVGQGMSTTNLLLIIIILILIL